MTAISNDLCEQFTRATKGKGRPKRDMVCGVCDATYSTHYPTGDALPRLAFPVLPTECSHFTKKDGKRGKPSPAAVCAVCRKVWTRHHPRGPIQPVLHPEAIRPTEITLSPKQGSTQPQQPVLTKLAVDKPKMVEAVVEVIEVEAEPTPVLEVEVIEVEAIIEPPAEAFEEPEESPGKPGSRLADFWAAQEKERLDALMAKGMSREEAQAEIDEEDDW